jgi:hypothetical protein
MHGKFIVILTAVFGPAAAALEGPIPAVVEMRSFNPPGPRPATRQEVCLNGEWEFCPLYDKGPLPSDQLLQLPPLPSSGWGPIRVPGKWKQVWGHEAVDAFGYPREWTQANRAWYRRTFTAPKRRPGRRLKLQFHGVLVYCEVLVNGRSVGRHLGGVTPFEVDLTEVARPGPENTLAVYVVNEEAVYIRRPRSRYEYTARAPIYYAYSQGSAGIWQDVFLVDQPEVFVDSVAIRTSYRQREIDVEVEVKNEGGHDVPVVISGTVEALKGKRVRDLGRARVTARAGTVTRVHLHQAWREARLWTPEDPHLYRLHTRVWAGDTCVDEHYQRFGFREFWIEGRSFFLNGRRLSLFGDWTGYYGALKDACLRPEYARAFVQHLKGMNYCGTRLHAIDTTPAVLDACDELGLPIIATGASDSAAFFDPEHVEEAMAHAKSDMLAWVKRDRNHPSILLWSTENEDQPSIRAPEVQERYREIDRVFLENDPTRPFLHDGAAVGLARSDMDGWSPILCPHYLTGGRSFGERLEALQEWQDGDYNKPLILGEEDVARSEEPGGYLFQMLGDRLFGELSERDALWSWYIKRLVGAWRTYGVGGIIAHSNRLSVATAPLYAYYLSRLNLGPADSRQLLSRPLLEFRWDDLATPYAKPKYLLGAPQDHVNPWLPAAPKSVPTPLYAATREAFSPILVTLSRSLAPNYFTGETCTKEVYLINEGPHALARCVLAWELGPLRGGPALQRGQRRLNLPQGAIWKAAVRFQLPSQPGPLRLTVTLFDRRGKRLAGDDLTLRLYAPPAVPDTGAARIILYDPAGAAGRTAKALDRLKIPYEWLTSLETVSRLEPGDLLVLGAGAVTREVVEAETLLKKHLANGGRILVFEQPSADRNASSFAFVRAPGHPAFRGLSSPYLSLWRTPAHNLCLGPLRVAGLARTTVLVDLASSPAMVESRLGSGTLILSNLELIEGCLQGEPEAQIITGNLLEYLATCPAVPPVRVRYLGGKTTETFLKETMRLAGVRPWSRDEPLASDDVIVVGEDTTGPESAADQEQVKGFVRGGGTVVGVGTPTPALTAWLPEPVEVADVPAAYLLKKKSSDRLLDGLGPLFLMRSERALNYFVADAIPDLQRGFRLHPGTGWQSWYRICDRETDEYNGRWRRSYYWESEVDAVACRPYGQGRYLLASLPLKSNGVTVDFLSSLFAQLRAPSTDTRCFLPFTALASVRGVQRAGETDWRGFVKIDLAPYCNRTFYDEVAGDGVGGWDDSGENDLRNLPTGDFLFRGVPFHLIDPQRDDPNEDLRNRLGHPLRSCIVLQGAARPQFPRQVADISVGEKLRRLYFLHTATWCGVPEGQPVARYVIHYADGSTVELVLRQGIHLDDWTHVSRGDLEGALVAWRGSTSEHPQVGLYLMPWTNPHPDKEIVTVDFVSEGHGIPILVALTGQRE